MIFFPFHSPCRAEHPQELREVLDTPQPQLSTQKGMMPHP